jgi:hypothetical protein
MMKYIRATFLIQEFQIMSKVKEIVLLAWKDPEASRRLRLPDFKTIGT